MTSLTLLAGSREVWNRDDALAALGEACRIIAAGIAPDGTQLADERESLLWGFVNRILIPKPLRSVSRMS